MIVDYQTTLEEFLEEIFAFGKETAPSCKKMAKKILPSTTGEPDWHYARVDVREREDGCPELVLSVPFGIKGL